MIKIVASHMILHVLLFAVFLTIYMQMGFERHFVPTQPDAPLSSFSPTYFAVATHTLLGDNSAVPKTTLAKVYAAAHALLAWAISLSAFGSLILEI